MCPTEIFSDQFRSYLLTLEVITLFGEESQFYEVVIIFVPNVSKNLNRISYLALTHFNNLVKT